MQCAALLGSVSGIKVSKSFGRGTDRIGKAHNSKTVPQHVLALRAPCHAAPYNWYPSSGYALRGSNGLAAGRESTEGGRPNRVDRYTREEYVFKLVERCAHWVRSRCEAQLCK